MAAALNSTKNWVSPFTVLEKFRYKSLVDAFKYLLPIKN